MLKLFAAPKKREAAALRGFDRLNFAGVVRLQKDAATVRSFSQRQSFAVDCDPGVLLCERISVQAQKSGDRLRLAGFESYISRHPAAGAAAQTSKSAWINQDFHFDDGGETSEG